MFGSVHLPRLLAAVVLGGLLCGLIGIAGIHVMGQARAQDAAQAPPAKSQNSESQNSESQTAKSQNSESRSTVAELQKLKDAAQADQQAEDAKRSTQTLPLAGELESQAQAMREHLKKMRKLIVQYDLSDTPAQTRALRAQWIRMLETGRTLHERMVQGALKDYRAAPDPASDTAAFLYNVAARNADADRFDNMLEVVQLLKETGYTAPQFDLCYGLTAAAHNEFEAARPHLQIAIQNLENEAKEINRNTEIPDEQRETLMKNMAETHSLLNDLSHVEVYAPLWEAEQEARQADAEGEPLPRVRIETTKGAFEVELFENQAPNTVANFISLCEQNFYNGLPFHRVLTHFMAQGGCPNRDGSGNPGYAIRTELGDDHRNFFRGTLGMALAAHPDSGGSQFFICYMPRARLNGNYVAFGRVIEGMNVLSDITHVDPDDKSKDHAHAPPDEIISTKVVRKRNHPYKPEKLPLGAGSPAAQQPAAPKPAE
ncbi:MAG: peptidylprolyl isomerase [Aureliella sp.]